jgi:hypothetical protein
VVCNSTPRGGYDPTCPDAPKSGGCMVSAASSPSPSEGTSASGSPACFALFGFGLLALARRSRHLDRTKHTAR